MLKPEQLITYEELTGIDDLDNIATLPLEELHPFKNHPFRVVTDDDSMGALIKSVQEIGILNPILVRPKQEGYEIISGHRRCYAAKQVGLKEVPAIVRDLNDDESIILMADSNLQREELLPSEKAWAYRMKLEAIKRQAGRPKKNSAQVEPNFLGQRSNEELASQSQDSRAQIQRYIRLTYLIPQLLELVDKKKIAMSPAVSLSYLTETEQHWVLETIETEGAPNMAQAQRLKELSKEGLLDLDKVLEVMMRRKPELSKIVFKGKQLFKFFPGMTPDQIELKVLEIVTEWAEHQQS